MAVKISYLLGNGSYMFNAILSGKKVRDKSAAVLYREEACAESDQCQYEANYKPNYDGDDYCYDAYSECF